MNLEALSERFAALDALRIVRHAFTRRMHGIDVQIDRERALERLEGQFREIRTSLGLDGKHLVCAQQIHGAEVTTVNSETASPVPASDGLITSDPDVCLAIYVADCCAVYLVDPVRRVIGLLHSGRKGSELGITARAIDKMRIEFGCVPADLVVQLSPCIRPPHYEIDFAQLILDQCRAAGVRQIIDCGTCTASNPEDYYSYRAERGKTGRMLALLSLGGPFFCGRSAPDLFRCRGAATPAEARRTLNSQHSTFPPPLPLRAFDENEPEMMDRPQPVTAELERDLLNLVSLNRRFGGHRLIRKFLNCWLEPERSNRMLDLATGSGDVPRLAVEWARARGISLRVDAVDAQASTLEIARRHSRDFPEIDFIRADARTFESAESYDLVCCSLALHHFSQADAVRILRRCKELSHRFGLVADLERSFSTLVAVHAVTAVLYRDPMTKFDGRLSARRAFSGAELRALAEDAGWGQFGYGRFAFCRQAIWFDHRTLGEVRESAAPEPDGLPCPT